MIVASGYDLDRHGRTVGYIRRYVEDKFYGFISNVPEAASLDEAHPSDVFFLAEMCSAAMPIVRGQIVGFRLVQIRGRDGRMKTRALDIVPLNEAPSPLISEQQYRVVRPAAVVPQMYVPTQLSESDV